MTHQPMRLYEVKAWLAVFAVNEDAAKDTAFQAARQLPQLHPRIKGADVVFDDPVYDITDDWPEDDGA